ncbi:BQ5605_C029g10631 [Microbotryum silenes-dioicae]|uniref:BQ5605_C029g10631 protein n=1 Tax=Microbotryum silenes-dioicae TaxID=796604 RepID=A0A2X0MN07_9BASI|nr:BQ5605_C029g10631 [Microbotryum silenes-dioicae]
MGRGGHWCTRPVPTSNRAKKHKSCLNLPARGSSFGWVNGPADLTAYCKEGRGRARLSPRRQTLAAKAEKTIVALT